MGSLDRMAIRGIRRLHRAGRQAGSGGVAFFIQLSAISPLLIAEYFTSSYHIVLLASEA